jgi:glycosyltransferase involved in cell wall biosynthesis
MVYWESLGSSPTTVWLKYLGQSFKTWQILLREHPDAVFVMSPPLFAGLVVIPYCAMRRIPFVIDAHTGAFLNPRWRHLQRVQHWICRRAATTIVTNTHLEQLLETKGADSTILPDVPVRYPESVARLEKTGFTVAVICSFVYDEPIDVILDTVRALPDVQFLMTGNAKNVPLLQGSLPANLRLTGFLDAASYGQLLRDADVVMALTTAKHTMLRAAYEAIYQGTPIIVSDSSLLRQEFPLGAVTAKNSPDELANAVREVRSNYDK